MEKRLVLVAFLLCQVLKIQAHFGSGFNTGLGLNIGGNSPVNVRPVNLNPNRGSTPSQGQNPATVPNQKHPTPVAQTGTPSPTPTPVPVSTPAVKPTVSDQIPPIPNSQTGNPNPTPAPEPAIPNSQPEYPNSSPNPSPEQKPPTPDTRAQTSAQKGPMSGAESALQAWKSTITDDPLKFLENWVGPDVCSYKGIFCYENEVASIDLNGANLQGTLVKELSFFKNMTIFHLNSNRFSGPIPDCFENLTCLEELDLSNNQFSGPFPAVTLCIPKLAFLDLRFNSFSGPIPEALFSKNLDAIFINNNNFDGMIPHNLGNAAASVINFANNKLTGSLPTNFGQLGCKVNEVVMLNNQLTGCMPPGIGLFPDLHVLDVSQNSLTGQIPDTLAQLKNIQVLNLRSNKFSGHMPDFCGIKSLMNLTVSNNFFSGFSSDCSKSLHNKLGFNFSNNCVTTSIWGTPRSHCSIIPGESLNCLRLPIPQPLACAAHALIPGVL